MKVALLIPANIWFCPYVRIYTNILEKYGVEYDIISWNKDGTKEAESIAFEKKESNNLLMKLIDYIRFSFFLKKTIKRNKYDRLIVFSSQIGIFLSRFLSKEYSRKYIFDFRDLSIEQNRIFRKPFENLVNNSFANVISSPGFKDYLPSSQYFLSHNFVVDQVKESVKDNRYSQPSDDIEVLTIGGIRDYETNVKIMDALGNQEGFRLKFVGKGPAKEPLERYSIEKGYKNTSFVGYYEKEEEPTYVKSSTFLNIYYPDSRVHKSALSNRFYNSLIYRKPMIVNKGQVQGFYAEKYNVGIAIQGTENLAEIMRKWLEELDSEEYDKACRSLLNEFLDDYAKFEDMVKRFVGES